MTSRVLSYATHSVLLLTLLAAPSYANSVHGQQFQDWGGNCQDTDQGESCYLEQVLHNGSQKAMVSVIGYLPGQSIPTLMLELPPPVHLAAGFSLMIDGKVLTRFKGRCEAQRCTAGLGLNPRIVAQLRQGRTATISYTPKANQASLQLPISLLGIHAGLNALKPK